MRKASNIIISLLIFFSVLILIFIFLISRNSKELEIEISKFERSSSVNIVEISNPIFKSKGLNTDTYIIKADKGIQNGDNIELNKIRAEFEVKNGKILYVYADKGDYSQLNETIKLSKNVQIIDELNNKTSTKKALIDIKMKKITLSEEVISISANSSVKSDTSVIDDLNKTITYSGNVKVQIKNE